MPLMVGRAPLLTCLLGARGGSLLMVAWPKGRDGARSVPQGDALRTINPTDGCILMSGVVHTYVRRASAAMLLLLLSACTNLFFYPVRLSFFSPALWGLTAEDVYLSSADGVRLHAWLLPSTFPSKATILFLHGTAQTISAHIGNHATLPM